MRSVTGPAFAVAISVLSLAATSVAYTPSQWGMSTRRSPMVMKQEGGGKEGWSLTNLFGSNDGGSPAGAASSGTSLKPHPSVRKHISPLNRLGPDNLKMPSAEPLPVHPDVKSGTLKNGLPYVILPNRSPPGRFEAHLQVFSGSGKCFLASIVVRPKSDNVVMCRIYIILSTVFALYLLQQSFRIVPMVVTSFVCSR